VQFLARRAARLVFTYYLSLTISFFLKLISMGMTQPSMGEARVRSPAVPACVASL